MIQVIRLLRAVFSIGVLFWVASCGSGEGNDEYDEIRPTEANGSQAEDNNPVDGGNHCLLDCSPPPQSQLSFAPPVSLAPTGCVVESSKAAATNAEVSAVITANCSGTSTYSYARWAAESGIPVVVPLTILTCGSFGDKVVGMTFSRNETSGLLSLGCKRNTGKFEFSWIILGVDGTPIRQGTQVAGASYQTDVQPHSSSWSESSGAYGVAFGSRFLRVAENGVLGASINLGDPAAQLVGSAAGWNVLIGSAADLTSYAAPRCSKISSQGILQCDRLALRQHDGRVAADRYDATSSLLVGMNSERQLTVRALDVALCSASQSEAKGTLLSTPRRFWGALKNADGFVISAAEVAENRLQVTVSDSTSGKIYAEVGLADAMTLGYADIFTVDGKVVVIAKLDNDVLLFKAR